MGSSIKFGQPIHTRSRSDVQFLEAWWVITNYDSFITNYGKKLLQITAALNFEKFKIITNYVKFYYILWHFLASLQITANFITNYGRYYKLRRYYKLHHNNYDQEFIETWFSKLKTFSLTLMEDIVTQLKNDNIKITEAEGIMQPLGHVKLTV